MVGPPSFISLLQLSTGFGSIITLSSTSASSIGIDPALADFLRLNTLWLASAYPAFTNFG
jgi:hypothetical protein